jgi:Icc protein
LLAFVTTLRFVHISDTHVGATPDYQLWGYSPYSMFEALVAHIKALPFQPDFVLHTGDVTQDASDEAYALVFSALNKLTTPVYYVPGNHDNPDALRRGWLGVSSGTERFDYTKDLGVVRLLAFDTRYTIPPGERLPDRAAGMMTQEQLQALREECQQDGPPLLIALHHQPVKLDSPMLDDGFDNDGVRETMMLECAEEFLKAIAPARDRICGVFFGHVHRGFQVMRDGILFCSAPSALLQFQALPSHTQPIKADDELPGFNVVTIQDGQTLVRQYTFPRPTI